MPQVIGLVLSGLTSERITSLTAPPCVGVVRPPLHVAARRSLAEAAKRIVQRHRLVLHRGGVPVTQQRCHCARRNRIPESKRSFGLTVRHAVHQYRARQHEAPR